MPGTSPASIPITLRRRNGAAYATVQAKPVTVAGMTMGVHKAVAEGPRGGLKTLPKWVVTEPTTGCSVGGQQASATDAINAARKLVRDQGGPDAVAKRIEVWQAFYARKTNSQPQAH